MRYHVVPVSLDTEWGSFTATASQEDGVVTVLQEFRSKPFRASSDQYDSFRTFIRTVNKAYGSKIVLVSQ